MSWGSWLGAVSVADFRAMDQPACVNPSTDTPLGALLDFPPLQLSSKGLGVHDELADRAILKLLSDKLQSDVSSVQVVIDDRYVDLVAGKPVQGVADQDI